MINKTIGFRGTQHFQTHPHPHLLVFHRLPSCCWESGWKRPWGACASFGRLPAAVVGAAGDFQCFPMVPSARGCWGFDRENEGLINQQQLQIEMGVTELGRWVKSCLFFSLKLDIGHQDTANWGLQASIIIMGTRCDFLKQQCDNGGSDLSIKRQWKETVDWMWQFGYSNCSI